MKRQDGFRKSAVTEGHVPRRGNIFIDMRGHRNLIPPGMTSPPLRQNASRSRRFFATQLAIKSREADAEQLRGAFFVSMGGSEGAVQIGDLLFAHKFSEGFNRPARVAAVSKAKRRLIFV